MRYSDNLTPYIEELPPAVATFVQQVEAWFDLAEPAAILEYNAYSVAIPVTFKVSLPTRKAVGGIDIRAEEPMLLIVNRLYYPDIIPSVVSDRRDFPAGQLAHLYINEDPNAPASLCLIRNNPHEWFANKTVDDLLTVASQWLFKAASGKLVADNDEWDPMRFSYRGHHIYPYNTIADIVKGKKGITPTQNFAFLMSYAYLDPYHQDTYITFRSLLNIPLTALPALLKGIYGEIAQPSQKGDRKAVISLLIWAEEHHMETQFFSVLPRTIGTLRDFFKLRGIDLDAILNTYKQSGCLVFPYLPLIYAARRPKKIISYDGNFEFINMRIDASEMLNENMTDDTQVSYCSHIEPFGHGLAAKLSGEDRDKKTLYIGAGSLGSKMIIHDARSGKMNMGVVDPDKFLQHNLARHALYENKVGLNKATAVIDEVKDLFESDSREGFAAYEERINFRFHELTAPYEWIVDTTASYDTLNLFSQQQLPETASFARAELADKGRLGILQIEGPGRNPRVDDLANLACYEAINNPDLAHWRNTDATTEMPTLSVGLGCSSTTNVIPDDTISFHAALFSRILYKTSDRTALGKKGLLYLSILDEENISSIRSEAIQVDPFELYDCAAGSDWKLRMKAGLSERLTLLMHQKTPNETGGILIGIANHKTKTIHVFDVTEESKDSAGTPIDFIRGTDGVKAFVDKIKEQSGQMIGYIGEWHSHPMNLEGLSITDIENVQKLIPLNRGDRIPTLSLVVTPRSILPFVFDY